MAEDRTEAWSRQRADQEFWVLYGSRRHYLSVQRGEIFGFLGPNGAVSRLHSKCCAAAEAVEGNGSRDRARFAGGSEQSQGPDRLHGPEVFALWEPERAPELDFFSGVYGLSGDERADAVRTVVEVFDLEPYLTRPLGNCR